MWDPPPSNVRAHATTRYRPVIVGIPGTPFQDEVVIRRLRWSSDETDFAIIDADRAEEGYDYVAIVAYDEPTELVQQYAPYRLKVNGVVQPGGATTD